MKEYRTPSQKQWVLIIHGQYNGCPGWIAADKRHRNPGWSGPGELYWGEKLKPNEKAIVVQVTKQHTVTGEYHTFEVKVVMTKDQYVMAQMELPLWA